MNPREDKRNGKQFAYLLECIENCSIIKDADRQFANDEERVNYLFDYQIKPMICEATPTLYKTIKYFLRGLGIDTIAFADYDIKNLLESWGLKANSFNINNYFPCMATRLYELYEIYNKTNNK